MAGDVGEDTAKSSSCISDSGLRGGIVGSRGRYSVQRGKSLGADTMSVEGETFEGLPVTICPPGRKSKTIVYREPILNGPPVSTATILKWPDTPVEPRLPKIVARSAAEADHLINEALRARAIATALAQPHRVGNDDKMLVDPLGVFCYRQWPRRIGDSGRDLNADHRGDMYRAGQRYAQIVHQHRVLMGLGSGGRTDAEGLSESMTEAEFIDELAKARALRENAEAVIREIGPGALSAINRVAVEENPPTPYQEGVLKHTLWKLAVHFAILKPGVR